MERNKIREFFLSPWFLLAAQVILSLAIAVGAVFYTYANVIVYRLWKIALIDMTFVFSCGALLALVFFEKQPECKLSHLLIPFVIGAGVYSALFFGLQAILDLSVNRTVSCFAGLMLTLAFLLACVIAQDFFATKRNHKFYLWITAVFTIGVYAGVFLVSTMILPHGWVFKSFSEDKHLFHTASAEAYAITESDKRAGKEWLTEHFASEEFSPVFDFALGGRRFSSDRSEWSLTTEETQESEDDVGKTIVFRHSSGVEARAEASYYAETATVEWTVYLTNTGSENSPVISDFYAFDSYLPIASPTLYFSGGSGEANDDFALYSRRLTSEGYVFDTVKGRTSMLYLPFFNLVGEDRGATIGIGWSGEWKAVFSAENRTKVRIGQKELKGYLAPGETIRSPLVSLCLYSGGNALKGFNNFRADILRGLPEGYGESSFLMFAGAEGQDDTSRANAAGTVAYIEKLIELNALDSLDYAWYDAAWYDTSRTKDWRDTIGDWTVDAAKYPEGLGAVSDYLEEKGVGMLLWYEPERVPMGSDLYRNVSSDPAKSSWLIHPTNGTQNCLWNMGDEAARQDVTARIVASLKENGVSYYRQDFNIDPKTYWERADKELYDGRIGFAENHYVVGEYAFLDALTEEIPGLLIDNCASGGRRIDLEMCRRSMPLWRSDYQCKKEKTDLSEAAQYQTYGLSLWLPYSCITDPNASSEYDFRSLLGGCVMTYADVLYDSSEEYLKFIGEYEQIKDYFAENYYPLTACTPREKFVALQFGTEERGVILLYSREGSKGERTVKLNGLSTDKNYRLVTIEGADVASAKGSDLLWGGFSLETEEHKAYLVLYCEE